MNPVPHVYDALNKRLDNSVAVRKTFLLDPSECSKNHLKEETVDWMNVVYKDLCRHHSIMNLWSPHLVRACGIHNR